MHVFLYTLTFCASIFHRQSIEIHMLLMHVFFVYTCFLCKYFSSSVDGNTHASHGCIFCIHLLFVQVFFIVSRWKYTCFSCMYFLCKLAFCTSIFHCQLMATHVLLMYVFCIHLFFVKVFFVVHFTEIHMLIFVVHT